MTEFSAASRRLRCHPATRRLAAPEWRSWVAGLRSRLCFGTVILNKARDCGAGATAVRARGDEEVICAETERLCAVGVAFLWSADWGGAGSRGSEDGAVGVVGGRGKVLCV